MFCRACAEAQDQNDKYDLVMMRIFPGRPHTPVTAIFPIIMNAKKIKMAAT